MKKKTLDFDQTQVGFTSPNKTTITDKGKEYVPITNKRQITVTFYVSISRKFLPNQLIYGELTDRCHPRIKFPNLFHITRSSNHCSSDKNCIGLFA